MSAQVWLDPLASVENLNPPLTSFGTKTEFVSPSEPSCPALLLPQQKASWSVVKPHVCATPGLTSSHGKALGNVVGTVACPAVCPVVSTSAFIPQHEIDLFAVTPQK